MISTENATHIQGYFRDPEKIKEMLMKDYSFTREAADAVLKSQVNLTSVSMHISWEDSCTDRFCPR